MSLRKQNRQTKTNKQICLCLVYTKIKLGNAARGFTRVNFKHFMASFLLYLDYEQFLLSAQGYLSQTKKRASERE